MKKVSGVYTHPKETYLSLEYTGSCGNIYQLFCNYIYISGNLDGAWWQQDGAAVHRNPAFMAELSEKFGGRVLAMGAEQTAVLSGPRAVPTSTLWISFCGAILRARCSGLSHRTCSS